MPDQLTAVSQARAGAEEARTLPWRRIVGIPVAFALAGVLGGVVFERLWTPPEGVAYNGRWFPALTGPDLMFSATALYVAVAATIGVVLGLAIAWLRGHEWVTLATTLVAALLAGWLMHGVGVAMGPEDPRPIAEEAPDLTSIEGDVRVAAPGDSRHIFTSTASLAMPIGALTGLCVIFLVFNERPGRRARPREPGQQPGNDT